METVSDLNWFALRVSPNYEFMVRGILRRRGLICHVKTEKRQRRKTFKDKTRSDIAFPISGYCFIGLKPTDPTPWDLRHCYHLIKSVVSVNGRPAILDAERLKSFLGYDDFQAPEHFKYLRTRAEQFQIGDVLKIARPAFEELNLPLIEMREGECIFHLTLFGKLTELRADPQDCYRAA